MTTLISTCPVLGLTIQVPATDAWLTQTSGPRPELQSMEPRTYEWTLRCPACGDSHTRPAASRVVTLLIIAGCRVVTRAAELDDPKRHTTRAGGRPAPALSIDDVIGLDRDLAALHLWGGTA